MATFPKDSLRGRNGYDRVVLIEDNGSLDLQRGQGEQIARAHEDRVFHGVWVVSIYGQRIYLALNQVAAVLEWTPEAMQVCDEDEDYIEEFQKYRKNVNGDSE